MNPKCKVEIKKEEIKYAEQMTKSKMIFGKFGLKGLIDTISEHISPPQDRAIAIPQVRPVFNIISDISGMANKQYYELSHHLELATKLSKEDMSHFDRVTNEGDIGNFKYTPEQLHSMGMSEDLIKAYTQTHTMLSEAIKAEMKGYSSNNASSIGTTVKDMESVVEKYSKAYNESYTNEELQSKKGELTPTEAKAWNYLSSRYHVGWAPREREGAFQIKIKVGGQTVHHERFDASGDKGYNEKVDEVNAMAKDKAEQYKQQAVDSLQERIDKNKEALSKASDRPSKAKIDPKDTLDIRNIADKIQALKEKIGKSNNPEVMKQMSYKVAEYNKKISDIMSNPKYNKTLNRKERIQNRIDSYQKKLDDVIKSKVSVEHGEVEDSAYTSKDIDIASIQSFIDDAKSKSMSNAQSREQVDAINQFYEQMRGEMENQYKALSFNRHQIKRSKYLITGYNKTGYVGSYQKYLHNLSASVARKEAITKISPFIKDMEGSSLKEASRNINEAFRSASKIEKKLNTIGAIQYINQFAGMVKGMAINIAGYIPQGVGELSYHGIDSKTASSLLSKGMGKATDMLARHAESFGNEDIAKVIDRMDFSYMNKYGHNEEAIFKEALTNEMRKGLDMDVIKREFSDAGSSRDYAQKSLQWLMILQRKSEELARVGSFISSYESTFLKDDIVRRLIAHRNHLSGVVEKGQLPTREQTAKFLSDNMNSVYGAINRNKISSGEAGAVTRAGFPMQNFGLHAFGLHIKYIKGAIAHFKSEEEAGSIEHTDTLASLHALKNSMLAYALVGGIGSIPAVTALDDIYKRFNDGISFTDEMKASSSEIQQMLAYGIGSAISGDMSNSFAFNVPYADSMTVSKISKWANSDYKTPNGDYPKFIIDSFISPELIKGIVKGTTDRDLETTHGGDKILDDELVSRTTWQSIAKVMGLERTEISTKTKRMLIEDSLSTYLTKKREIVDSAMKRGEEVSAMEDEVNNQIDYINDKYGLNYKVFIAHPTQDKKYGIEYGSEE